MTLKEVQQIRESLVDLMDFAHGSCDGDESGIYEEMSEHYAKSIKIVDKETKKLYLRNAMVRVKRKRK